MTALVGLGPFQQDVRKSRPIREAQWKEMGSYIESLPIGAREPFTDAFHAKLGYPPPSIEAAEEPEIQSIGQDRLATYHRVFHRIGPSLTSYGMLMTPKAGVGGRPLLVVHPGAGGFPELIVFLHGNYEDVVAGALERGFAVYVPHYIFRPYSDRDDFTPIPPDVRERFHQALTERGTTLVAVEIAKTIRTVQALRSHPSVDPARVISAGLSYGGFFALYLAALCPWIAATVVSCAFRERNVDDPSKPRSGIALAGSIELASHVCPRPLFVQAAIDDHIYPIGNVREAVGQTRKIYAEHSAHKMFHYAEFIGDHRFHGASAWPFLERYSV